MSKAGVLYKRGDSYYILGVHPMDGNIILKGKWSLGSLLASATVERN